MNKIGYEAGNIRKSRIGFLAGMTALLLLFMAGMADAKAVKVDYWGHTYLSKGALGFSDSSLSLSLKNLKLSDAIPGTYLLHFTEMTPKYVKATIVHKNKTVYLHTNDVIWKVAKKYPAMYASHSIQAYVRPWSETRFGSISAFDKVEVVASRDGYTQVIYTVKKKKYHGWIKDDDARYFLTEPPTGIRRLHTASVTFKGGTKAYIGDLVMVLPANTLQAVRVKIENEKILKQNGKYLIPLRNGRTKVVFSTLNGHSVKYNITVKR